ncbi:MAG TPA: M20/M25/M40 family metallo-hydrolase, partial [Planctomycetes bacterium]|nr:M20/M25/M40 family metallo-hydrolase [Planctomycetota bacterium]
EEFLASTGAPALFGEKGFSTLERIWTRPTCEVNGIFGGYRGEGGKTIVPSGAGAKITMRLVPDQDPREILDLFEAHVLNRASPGVRVEVKKAGGADPVSLSPDSPLVRAAARALEKAFGKGPLYTRSGGSIPVVGNFKKILGLDTLLLGFGLESDRCHSPNEKFSLESFHKGILTSAWLMKELALEPG